MLLSGIFFFIIFVLFFIIPLDVEKMVSFTTSFFTIVLLAISQFYGVSSAPASPLNAEAREILARATPAAPHWVIYSDSWTGSNAPPDPSTLTGFNAL
jgi:hypothetical protein